jgi:2-dehydro-3-deoxygalactonokinase
VSAGPPRIIVDWGTSSFRAYRFGESGEIVETHRAAAGILSVASGGFAEVLQREIGGWLAGGAEVSLSGMITSRNGWVETPYVSTPATLADLRDGAVRRQEGDLSLSFLPGVSQAAPVPDVMRGEEIQVFGSFARDADGIAVLPGTHSKWVRVERGRITGFRSFMTGEVFAVLTAHSILGRLIPQAEMPFNPQAFAEGVAMAARAGSAGVLGDIFSARSGVLLGALSAEHIRDRLSGLLIGHEIAGATSLGWTSGDVMLIGDPALCARYGTALDASGITSRVAPPDAAVEGFRRLDALK